MYDVYVSSNSLFTPFEYDGMSYVFLRSRIDEGVENKADGVRVTDLEHTVIDSINDFEKVGGLEELLRSLSMLPFVDEEKLLYYLKCYNKQVLYQKVGYILEHFKEEINISENFFNCCETGVFKSVRYLHKNLKEIETEYNKRWRVFVPKNLLSIISEGGNDDARI